MRVSRTFSILSLITGLLAGLAALQITIEKMDLLRNPHYIPSCSINPFISCGPIMSSPQASVLFGVPNSIFGMVGFGLVVAITLTSLFTRFPRWYWIAYTIGIAGALTFCIWLMTQAMLVIGALCIYCLFVWLCTILLFWSALAQVTKGTRLNWINDYRFLLGGLTYVALLACLFFAFKDGWLSLL